MDTVALDTAAAKATEGQFGIGPGCPKKANEARIDKIMNDIEAFHNKQMAQDKNEERKTANPFIKSRHDDIESDEEEEKQLMIQKEDTD